MPELLRTPLQSLCLQIKSLELGSISEFLSSALQAPEPLSVSTGFGQTSVLLPFTDMQIFKMLVLFRFSKHIYVVGSKCH